MQFLAELAGVGLNQVFAVGRPVRTPSQLLPNRFGPEDLLPGFSSSLLDQGRHFGLQLQPVEGTGGAAAGPPPNDAAALAALREAVRSYAPYSSCPSGVAIRTRKGGVHAGGYLECAAYNPSLPPLQAALVAGMAEAAMQWEEIEEVTLVELEQVLTGASMGPAIWRGGGRGG